ncbi:S8 family serine peptidase [Streptomyces sp. NPDC093225]|uniref:S8 family serine peptidase n=1 Tax=Streptomyces sp. NPDC093225 TaxID=3366034 RepID=UPI0037F600BE
MTRSEAAPYEACKGGAPPGSRAAAPFDLVGLTPLMRRTSGTSDLAVGLIDGPVATGHPELVAGNVREVTATARAACTYPDSHACRHGTFVAGVLAGRRGSGAPAICPGCTLLVRPIFAETAPGHGPMPTASPEDLAEAIRAVVAAGASVVNISADLRWSSARGCEALTQALDDASRRGVIVVAAAGNQGLVGGSALTRHASVVPVAACDVRGRLLSYSNLGATMARRGLRAPGEGIVSLQTAGRLLPVGGTSVSAPLVTGAIALLWSLFPTASAARIRHALLAGAPRGLGVAPPLLDAWGAHRRLAAAGS